MTKYANLNLPGISGLCLDCKGYCEEACSYGVWTRPLMAMAQQNMEMIVS